MTISDFGGEERLIILPEECDASKTINTFTLPPPANIASKPHIELFENTDGKLYKVTSYQFGKGPSYSHEEDLANNKYHYTKENHPIKSTFIVNTSEPTDGYISGSSKLYFCTLHDIAFSLIGFHYRNSISVDEQDYVKSSDTEKLGTANRKDHERFLTVRDYHDLLTDNHDNNWSNISSSCLEGGLAKISETIEEAGDVYYKITPAMISRYLVGKVSTIIENFPPSVPILKHAPAEIEHCYKVVMATNILVSLIPKAAYHNLVEFSATATGCFNLDIKASFTNLENYETTDKLKNAEKELLMKSAMNVGISSNVGASVSIKKVTKKIVQSKKSRVAIGKGAIDGFFKRR
ncbi:rnh202p [Saccharomyces arboricola H-6]|uniref:Ribonuclease H2 subunit B n=1 Tax=Saccharomyces arboricola (strain H-6 / AS 2.3317 / CBS 10644) TaxID=1160507 RepID=J8PJH3_SACAR|nr:rnh202p [Saccharomyces arboricola H-6]